MPIANYSTEVPAIKSVGEIQGMLAAHHAKAILMDYDDDGEPNSVSFIIKTPQGEIPFRLPSNISKVKQVLLNMRKKKPETWHYDYEKVMKRIDDQAKKVAWRILKDWVRAQMAIIETEMVTIEQVFLPYMQIHGAKTLYEAMVEKGFYLPEGRG